MRNMKILFVCTGNVSRSYLAEMLLKDEIRKNRLQDVEVASAGVHAYDGSPADPKMIEFLSAKGIGVEHHESRTITNEMIDWADLILVMEKNQLKLLEVLNPDVKAKTKLLGRYISADQAEDDIIDPFGGSPYHYRLVQSQISLAIRSLAEKLQSD